MKMHSRQHGNNMHPFRRLNVTWRQKAGATPLEAQQAAGHASLAMTYLYTQTDEARERAHVNTIYSRVKPAEEEPKLVTMKAVGGVH